MNSRQLAFRVQDAIEEKKGIDPVMIDIRKVTDIADYFLIVHGTSERHVKTIAEGIVESLEKEGIEPVHKEGLREAKWVLIDFGDVIAHVFYYDMRPFYNLERLWGDGKIVKRRTKHEKPAERTRRPLAS